MTTGFEPRLVLVAALALVGGWFLHGLSGPAILAHAAETHAGTAGSLTFELSGVARDTSLTVYSADTHTLYVYPAVSQGNSLVSCEFMLQLGRVGGPVQRKNCEPGTVLPEH